MPENDDTVVIHRYKVTVVFETEQKVSSETLQSVASVVEEKLMKLGLPDQGQEYPIVTGISEAGSRKRKKA